MKTTLLPLALLAVITTGCQNETDKQTPKAQETPVEQPADPHDLKALAQALGSDNVEPSPAVKPITTPDGKIRLDWSQIDTKTKAVAASDYAYPFAKDSQPVQNYAKAYNITAEQAQYSMLLSMASPEALGKILDQLTDQYLGHEFRDGSEPALIIHTTADVVGEKHDYILADKFGEGLTLPIEIRPKSAK